MSHTRLDKTESEHRGWRARRRAILEPHVQEQLRRENTKRLRILYLVPGLLWGLLVLLGLSSPQLPTPDHLRSYHLIGLITYVALYVLLWIRVTADSRILHGILVAIWVIALILEPGVQTEQPGQLQLLFFLVGFLLLNLFVFVPPPAVVAINGVALGSFALRVVGVLPGAVEGDGSVVLGILLVGFVLVVLAALTAMSLHEYHATALRIHHERELEKQRDELSNLHKLRDSIDRMVRHDLRNPLNGILGFTEIAQDESELPQSLRKYLPIVEQSAYTMLDLINNSMDLFQMEEGSYDLEPRPVELGSLIKSVLGEVEIARASKELTVDYSGSENDEVRVSGERAKLHSMFSNLIVNAVEASPRAASLTIRVREEGEEVAVRIHNYGVVPDDVRDRFFERYATSGKKRGTGLGTYSARLIARTHGGDISFTSTEQEGTWVEVRLPVGAQRYSDTMEASVS